MRKLFLLLIFMNLAGLFLLSACSGTGVETPVAASDSTSPVIEKSPQLPTPTLTVKTIQDAKPTQTPALPTRTSRPTITPTVTGTLKAVDAAAEIDLLLANLAADLENTEIILETEIP